MFKAEQETYREEEKLIEMNNGKANYLRYNSKHEVPQWEYIRRENDNYRKKKLRKSKVINYLKSKRIKYY